MKKWLASIVIAQTALAGGLIVDPYRFGDADALDYFARIVANGSTISTADKAAVTTFVLAAKANSYWTNLIDCSPLAGNDLTAALTKLKYASYASNNLVNHSFVSGDYTTTTGLKGASGKWCNTGVNFTNVGATGGLSFYMPDKDWNVLSGNTHWLIGCSYASPYCMLLVNAGQQQSGWGTTALNFNQRPYSFGLYRAFSDTTTSHQLWIGDNPVSTGTTSSTTTRDSVIALMGNPAGASTWTNHCSWYGIDDGQITGTKATNFNTDLHTLNASLGRLPTPFAWVMNFVPLIGQSLAYGTSGGNALTTPVTTNELRMPTSSAQAMDVGATTRFAFVNFPKMAGLNYELAILGLASGVSHFAGAASNDLAVAAFGVGGAPYSSLKSGTANYTSVTQNVSRAKLISSDYNTSLVVPGFMVVHGEGDNTSTTYSNDIVQWQSDYSKDVCAITGQTNAVPFFHSQISSWTSPGYSTNKSSLAMLAAYQFNPNTNVLVCPKYFLTYADGLHLTNSSYRWLGEYYAKAWKTVVVDKQRWYPLYPTNISRTLVTIDLTFPTTNDLTFDTTLVSQAANYGFEYFDDGALPPTILSVNFTGTSPTNTVRIILTSNPVGNARIRYAFTGTNSTGASAISGPRGNLKRPETAYTSLYGNNLDDWCLHFDYPLP